VGALAVILYLNGSRSVLAEYIGLGRGIFFMMLGFVGLLYHAFIERDQGYRRMYGFLGGGLLGLGILASIWPGTGGHIGAYFVSLGAPGLGLALCFLVSFIRHETDPGLRFGITRAIAVVGGAMILYGFVRGLLDLPFLMGAGVIYLLLGLLYACAYVAIESPSSPRGYRAGLALGVVGGLMLLIALLKGLPLGGIPGLGWIPGAFSWVKGLNQIGASFLFGYLGFEFLVVAVGICSDRQLVVLTRRELGAFFFSPVAYIVLVALAVLGGGQFLIFLNTLAGRPQGLPEPIVQYYIFSLVPVICAILVVPVITMRLLSEEHRSGTLEVLLTAPVRESTVVWSKFLAALRVFTLAWYPWALYLVALWVESGVPFDYRPVLSFALALLVTGAGFVAMGLFFSSLTKNQIVAAILTLMGMILLLAVFLVKEFVTQAQTIGQPNTFWTSVLTYVSFLDLWLQSSGGQVAPRFMFFHVSFAIFFLFLTMKVLESRKWR
jgi:ABC-type transport system involved in multi-copper enzyme maturation permease subunit